MRFFIINTGYGMTEEAVALRVNRMKAAAAADTQITMECLAHTQICIDSQLDVALAAPEIIQKAIEAEKRGYDAVGLYCTSDPALTACREAVSIPVIGAGAAAFATAMLIGHRYSFITTSEKRSFEKEEFARQCGIDMTRLASIRSIEYDNLGENGGEENVKRRLREAVEICIEKDRADVAILGCLSFAGMGPELSAAVGIPVIDPAYTLVAAAEALFKQRLSHSKRSYAYPPSRRRSWGGGVIEI